MHLPLIKKWLLLILNAFLVYYLFVAGVNLVLRLTTALQPACSPYFCSQVIDETNACLIKTPGAESCIKIAGNFFVLSPVLSFGLLGLSLLLAWYFSKRFYLSRILIVLLFFGAILFFSRVLIGAIELSPQGMLVEFNKLGLNPPVFGEVGSTLLQMFYPKF